MLDIQQAFVAKKRDLGRVTMTLLNFSGGAWMARLAPLANLHEGVMGSARIMIRS